VKEIGQPISFCYIVFVRTQGDIGKMSAQRIFKTSASLAMSSAGALSAFNRLSSKWLTPISNACRSIAFRVRMFEAVSAR
jgi:hypothetical protein